MKIKDDEWFELQFNVEEALRKYGIKLPAIPSEATQVGFTGLSGRVNLQQAFSFYRYICSICEISHLSEPTLLDFGGGWGRVARFFLRDTKPENIYIVDTMNYAIELLSASGANFHVIHNQPRPPILGLTEQFDMVYAYSVFSHLSEEYFHSWVNYLLSVLHPGGYLAFTTRGNFFINHLEHLHKDASKQPAELQEHIRRLREEMPLPNEIRRRYKAGDFQFYPIGGAGELTTDFFGEAFIPKAYIQKQFSSLFVDFNEDVPNVDQSVVILRKPV